MLIHLKDYFVCSQNKNFDERNIKYEKSVPEKCQVSHFSKLLSVYKTAPDFPDINPLSAQLTFIISIPANIYIIAFKDKNAVFTEDP